MMTVDQRWYQILFLGTFLAIGIATLGWAGQWPNYVAVIGVTVCAQILIERFTTRRYQTWKSALITSLSLCLLLKTDSLAIHLLAGILAVTGKYVIRFRGKHIFNPANFGIVAVILLTGQAWVSPGQWGNSMILLFLFCGAGLMVVGKVGRVDTTLTFGLTFFTLLYLRLIAYLGWPLDLLWHKFSSGALLLFAFFMITDPRTIPDHKTARVVWASIVGVVSFILLQYFNEYAAPIWALFFCAPLAPVLDALFKAKRFEWRHA